MAVTASHLSPLTSHHFPLTSSLSPLPSHLFVTVVILL